MKFDIVLVIALVVAVIVFIQLRNVLGKRTGFERPSQEVNDKNLQRNPTHESNAENVVSLSKNTSLDKDVLAAIDAIAPKDSAINLGLRAIRKADNSFTPQAFLDGVKIAYEMVLTSFANGDKQTLKNLLSKEVYEEFSNAITNREENGESVDFTFISVNKAEIKAAELVEGKAQITLRIVSEMISASYDRDKNLIDGDKEAIAEITDLWTFARNSRSKDPNWKLVATQDDQA